MAFYESIYVRNLDIIMGHTPNYETRNSYENKHIDLLLIESFYSIILYYTF